MRIPYSIARGILCGLVFVAAGTGIAEGNKQPPRPEMGRWDLAPPGVPKDHEIPQQDIEALNALGYLGTTTLTHAPGTVTVIQPEKVQPGNTLVISGHDFEVYLIDLLGNKLHVWRYAFHDRFTDRQVKWNNMWFMAHLFPDGDLLALQDGFGVFRINKESEFLWGFPCHAHHDMHVMEDESVYLLHSRKELVPEFSANREVVDDKITLLDAGGNHVRTISVLRALIAGGHQETLDLAQTYLRDVSPDVLHTNTITMVNADHPELPTIKQGNLLLSSRSTSTIMVLDLATETITWTMSGDFLHQHCPHILPDGAVLLFDNESEKPLSVIREIDPITGKTQWAYRGTKQHPFYSHVNGRCHRLENGNTLIAESVGGRALEVTPSGELVWEYWNPHRGGAEEKYIARIFEVIRIPQSHTDSWLKSMD